jgi:hypothetical protein
MSHEKYEGDQEADVGCTADESQDEAAPGGQQRNQHQH